MRYRLNVKYKHEMLESEEIEFTRIIVIIQAVQVLTRAQERQQISFNENRQSGLHCLQKS